MKFGTLVDLTKKWIQKKFLKNSHYYWSYDHFKNVIFTRYASVNMLKFLLNS